MANYSMLFGLVIVGVCAAIGESKPVARSKQSRTTTTPSSMDDETFNDLFDKGLMSLGSGVTCDSWIEGKLKETKTNIDDLAKMIVEAEPKELALEFIVFCLMDDQPMSNRPSLLKSAIDDEKASMSATTPPPPPSVKAKSAKAARHSRKN